MSFSVQVGLLLAIATAFASVVGFLYKHRGATESPAIEWRRPVRTSLALFRSRWYVLGMGIAMASWGLHVAALALAPISLVQAVIAGGLVLLTVCADKLFGLRVTRREWIGVALVAAGLAFLAATLGKTGNESHSSYGAATFAAYVVALIAMGIAAAVGATRMGRREGYALGLSAGLLWGASDVTIKAVSHDLGADGVAVLVDPMAFVILALSLAGLTVSAKSLQLGEAVPVIAITSAAANVVTIAAGPIVFSEPLPDQPLALGARILAFVLVVAAAALTPPPRGRAEPEPAPA